MAVAYEAINELRAENGRLRAERDAALAGLKSLCFVDLGDDVPALVDHIAQHIADLAWEAANGSNVNGEIGKGDEP
jgi:hypothetical protein